MARNLVAQARLAVGVRAVLAVALLVLAAVAAAGEEVPLVELGSILTGARSTSSPVVLSGGDGILYVIYVADRHLAAQRSDDNGQSFRAYDLGDLKYYEVPGPLKLFRRIDDEWLVFFVAHGTGVLALALDDAGNPKLADLGPFYHYETSFDVVPIGSGCFVIMSSFVATVVNAFGDVVGGLAIGALDEALAIRAIRLPPGDAFVTAAATFDHYWPDPSREITVTLNRGGYVYSQMLPYSDYSEEAAFFQGTGGEVRLVTGPRLRLYRLEPDGGEWTWSYMGEPTSAGGTIEAVLLPGGAHYIVTDGSDHVHLLKEHPDYGWIDNGSSALPLDSLQSERWWRFTSGHEIVGLFSARYGPPVFLALDVRTGTWRQFTEIPDSLRTAYSLRAVAEPWSRVHLVSVEGTREPYELVGYAVRGQGFEEVFRARTAGLAPTPYPTVVTGSATTAQALTLGFSHEYRFFDESGRVTPVVDYPWRAVPSSHATAYVWRTDYYFESGVPFDALHLLAFDPQRSEP